MQCEVGCHPLLLTAGFQCEMGFFFWGEENGGHLGRSGGGKNNLVLVVRLFKLWEGLVVQGESDSTGMEI